MALDLLLKFIVVLVPLVYIRESIIQYRKGEYDPLIFKVEEQGFLKKVLLNFALIVSIQHISDKFFTKTAIIIIIITFVVIANTLNFKFIFIKFNKKVLYHTIIFNIICIILFSLIILIHP